jgi:hypothetical protein
MRRLTSAVLVLGLFAACGGETSTGDFPNMCTTGPCGCAPSSSHDVKICQCPGGKCFDGTKCQ